MFGLGAIVARVINFYVILIVIYAIMGWFMGNVRGGLLWDFYRVLASVCEPFLGLFRRILPAVMVGASGIDFSPLVAIVVLQVVADLVAATLH